QKDATLLQRFGGHRDVRAIEKPVYRKKEKQPASHLVTRTLLLEKRSLEDIARRREMKLGTVLDHCEKLQVLRELPDITHLKDALPERDFEAILAEFTRSPDGKLGPVRSKLGNRHSWEELRLVRLFVAR